MLKHLATVVFSAFATLLPGGQSLELHAQEKPSRPLFPTVFLKPGETQHLVLSAPESKIGARDRTTYNFTPVNEAGDKSAALKGIAVKADTQRMGELWDSHKTRFVAITLSATADAEPGIFPIRIRAVPFAGPPDYETTVRLVVAKKRVPRRCRDQLLRRAEGGSTAVENRACMDSFGRKCRIVNGIPDRRTFEGGWA